MKRQAWLAALCATVVALGGCTTATVVRTGIARAPIDASAVQVYAHAPTRYEVVGSIHVRSDAGWTAQGSVDRAIAKLKAEAAKLGGNGVLLKQRGEQYEGSSAVAMPLGYGAIAAAIPSYAQVIDAEAIYVGADAAVNNFDGQPVVSGSWPLPMPQFDTYATCHSSGAGQPGCEQAEHAAMLWLSTHATSVQIAGYCESVGQSAQSYTLVAACVHQREAR